MNLSSRYFCLGLSLLGSVACGNSAGQSRVSSNGTAGAPIVAGAAGGAGGALGSDANSRPPDLQVSPEVGGSSSSGPMCDAAGHCTCSDGNTTTIEGYVYDPASKNPLYNISVYVPDPASPLPNLDNVPLGCGCSQLFPAKVLATGAPTDATGHFQIPCAPSGSISLVVQTGKWRKQYDGVAVLANQPNKVPNMRLPANSAEGSLPNIAIATGASDSLECLPLRIGVAASEYVSGSATGGHIHIYSGYHGATMAQGSVEAYRTLWDQQAHLNEHDVVLLSCEGRETTGGTPGTAMNATSQGYMMDYVNTGGRVFASHYQYAWFNTGPFATGANNVATWITGPQQIDDTVAFPSDIATTLAGGAAFPEGSALGQWLGMVGALTANQLPIWFARNNVQALVQPPATEWIHLDASAAQAPSATQYFSIDTPAGAGSGGVCGRVVYSDLHVSGGPGTNAPGVPPDYPNALDQVGGRGRGAQGVGVRGGTVPAECAAHPLTPQEEALEFMLFDLSSCLVPIGESPTVVR
jgi:hypothetical protein